MTHETFQTRTIRIVSDAQIKAAMSLIPHLPVFEKRPLVLTIELEKPTRKLDQNAAMWSGPLKDIEQQAFIEGRQFSAVVWHEHFKELFLPDENSPGFDESHVKKGYKKYDFTPSGVRVLVGSTTELTVKGFAIYLTQVEAFGANLGVMFSVNPKLLVAA